MATTDDSTELNTRTPCSSCDYHNPADAAWCGMCGTPTAQVSAAAVVPERDTAPSPPPTNAPARGDLTASTVARAVGAFPQVGRAAVAAPADDGFVLDDPETTAALAAERVAVFRDGMKFLAVGAVLAPLLSWGPFLSKMGWFLGALFHEIGHTVVAWFFGMPAYPAIRLDGHAASLHQPQIVWLAWGICLGLGWGAWAMRAHRGWAIALGASAVVYPVLAFTRAGEFLHLVGGHLGELAMATICFWRTLEKGFTQSKVERGLYAMLGWFLVGDHLVLAGGLAFSEGARWNYANNGSFGLTNDYIRVSEDVLRNGLSLGGVGLLMAFVSLLPLPLAWLIWRRGR